MLRRALFVLALLALTAVAVGAVIGFAILRHLDAVVVEKFNGRRWSFPSRIYSDAFLIYPGLDLRAAGLYDRLQRLNYREAGDEPLRKGDFRRSPTGLDLFLRDFSYPGQHVDDRLAHLELAGDVVLGMRDLRSGESLYSLQLEPELISGLYDAT
jgi:penicillin-binding protein 1B